MNLKSIPLSRRDFLHGTTSLAAASLLSGCTPGVTTGVPPDYPSPLPNAQPEPVGPITQAALTVSTATAASIGPAFAGLSYEKSILAEPLFTASNGSLISLFNLIGPSVLRIGGNSVDLTVWAPNGAGLTSGEVAPSDIAYLAAFAKAVGWQVLYGINLGGAATGATTPALAAAEVAYAVEQFGSDLLGIEIGNECDLYGNAGSYFAGNWSLAQFETLWNQFRSAILTSSPGVAITGPASASNISSWTVPFAQQVTKSEISLLTQHYYRGDGSLPSATADFLISPDTTLISDLSLLQAVAQQVAVPFRMSECNSFYDGGSSTVSSSYASSLWVIDYLFNCAQGGAAGVNFHGGNSSSYTPIANSGGTVIGARPEFYGILLFALAGPGPLLGTQLSTGSLNVTAYAVKSSTDGTNLIVVNKDSTQNLSLNIQLPQAVKTASLLAMSAPSLTSTIGVTIQMAAVSASGVFYPASPYTLPVNGDQVSCYVPALGAVLIRID